MDDDGFSDQILASAAKYLIEGGEFDAANVLLSCAVEVTLWEGAVGRWDSSYLAKLTGPRAACESLRDEEHPIHKSIRSALAAVMPHGARVYGLEVKAEQIEPLSQTELEELRQIARGHVVHNQALGAERVVLWNRMRFRSKTETKIAEALDSAGVMFLPNCLARITGERGRVNREADFLVCHQGRWGILEVDGDDFHRSSQRTATSPSRMAPASALRSTKTS